MEERKEGMKKEKEGKKLQCVYMLSSYLPFLLDHNKPNNRQSTYIFIFTLRCRTVALETGMQNTQLCSTIVQLSFSPEDLNLVFTFPLIYSIFQIVFAAILLGGKQ